MTDWSNLKDVNGSAEYIPELLEELKTSYDREIIREFSIYIKAVGEMVGNRITKPAKTPHKLLWVKTKIWSLGHDLFPKSLTSSMFQPKALNEA